jgi:hypothetical protein
MKISLPGEEPLTAIVFDLKAIRLMSVHAHGQPEAQTTTKEE